MKRHSFLALILCALFVVVGTGCSSQNSGTQSGAAQKTTKSAQLANPVKTYDSLAKAEKAAGFKFTVPEGVNLDGADYAQYYWSTINEDLIEVRYGGEGDEVCYMRKAGIGKGDKAGEVTDISGDYNVYDKVKEVDITLEDGREATVTLKGQKNILPRPLAAERCQRQWHLELRHRCPGHGRTGPPGTGEDGGVRPRL